MGLRNAAKALIRREDRILVTENTDDKGLWYILPGGGMKPCKETLLGALKRECKEEIGTEVEVEDLVYVREYITDNYPDSWSKGGHLVDFIFRCSVPEGYDPSQAPVGDVMQVGVKWMRVSELKGRRFYPGALLEHLEAGSESSTVYLGDVT